MAMAPAFVAALEPQHLECEYLPSPIGIDAAHPRLSWLDVSSRREERQTAYRVLAATTKILLKAGKGDLWDSGKVASDDTAQVAYSGRTLASCERAFWAVRVWDGDDRPSAWSEPVAWEMGLLLPDDWHGKWIARAPYESPESADRLPLPLLRREFKLDGKVKQARAYVIGLGYFELSANGQKVGDHLLDPGYTRYDRRILYVSHDITTALRNGENVVGLMLGNGWFNVPTKAAWGFDQAPWRQTPRLLMEIRIEMADGRVMTISSDENWKTSDSPITFSSIYGGENYDARLEQPGWDKPGFDDRSWQPALPVDAPKGRVVAQAIYPIRVDRLVKPISVSQPAPGVCVFDAGQNLTGDAEICLSGAAGTTVTLRYGERLGTDGRVDQSGIGVHVLRFGQDQQFQTDRYTLKGHGLERWHSRFNYNGFRYVEVTGAPSPLTADNLTIRCFHSAVPEVGSFTCSNPLLNKIWENGRWSYLSNLFGIPTDCPHREKNGWTGDAQFACEQGLFYADGITVYEKWMNDIADEQLPNGMLPGICPSNGTWGYMRYGGPSWDSAFLLIPWYLYEYYGDSTALRVHYPEYLLYLNYLTSRARNRIVDVGLPDWSTWKTETPAAVTDTAYYYRDARIIAAVARMLGKSQDAAAADNIADEIRTAFNKEFYHPETGDYSVGSQTALGCALYQDMVEPANESKVLDRLVSNITGQVNQGHLDFGFLGAKYVLNTLTDHGRADVAYGIVSQKTQPGWGWQVGQGATTLWEDWEGSASLNHTFFGDVNAWMMKTVAGVNPDPANPGFKHILIRPDPVGDLTWARGSYDSIRGRIESEWHKESGRFRLTITIPANTSATVYLPANAADLIQESGKPLAEAQGVKLIQGVGGVIPDEPRSSTGRQGNLPTPGAFAGLAVIEIQSGRYEFTSTLPSNK